MAGLIQVRWEQDMKISEISDFIRRRMSGPDNRVGEDTAISPELVDTGIYGTFAIGVASPDDALFERCREPDAVGPHFMPPRSWLPEAGSVVSVFFHVAPQVAESNARKSYWPSGAWLHAKHEGQKFISATMVALRDELEKRSHSSIVPVKDPRFESGGFTSNWSERHAAHVCGLGTFGLSRGLITKIGVAGRFGSLVTALVLPPTAREYSGLYDWCVMCGACVKNCPAGAISVERGKNHVPCSEFLDRTEEKYAPRYGCGKCQVSVPCQDAAPGFAP